MLQLVKFIILNAMIIYIIIKLKFFKGYLYSIEFFVFERAKYLY